MMRCDCCPLASYDDVCPECEGEYGIEYKDGSLGCRHPRNWVDKRDEECSNHYGDMGTDMGTDMGIEMSLNELELDAAINFCKHMIGLDYKSPYHRHGKAFYKPYRNYCEAPQDGNPILDKLPFSVIERRQGAMFVWYSLTKQGLAWLGRQLKITIWEGK